MTGVWRFVNVYSTVCCTHTMLVQVEKVAPMLKVRMKVDNKDWRTHLDQMKENHTVHLEPPGARQELKK